MNNLLPTQDEKDDKALDGYNLYISQKNELSSAAREFWRPADAAITLLGGGSLVTSVTLLTAFGPSDSSSRRLLLAGWILIVGSLVCSFVAKWLMVLIHQLAINMNESARYGDWETFRDRLRDLWKKHHRRTMRLVRGVYICYSLACALLLAGMIALLCYAAPTSNANKDVITNGKATPTLSAAPTSTASSAVRSPGTQGTSEGSVPNSTGRSASEAGTEQTE